MNKNCKKSGQKELKLDQSPEQTKTARETKTSEYNFGCEPTDPEYSWPDYNFFRDFD